ncbi:murein transglycosylase [Aliidongia dinghuensis]|uniref:Murein transglycosylase n=1 Tax=Aliidongia dinghuensis TaxID=1867774 RepID=A0A8J2YT63_9PROT|nr:lytic murein transglycosylase [Aliidongia dinghuensis]GGF14442.1 murein transglycosylase [Aliidongia dinghuensis]
MPEAGRLWHDKPSPSIQDPLLPVSRRQLLVHLAAAAATPLLIDGIRPASAADQDFPTWLAAFRQEALGTGIRAGTFDAAFAGVAPLPHVLELDQRQPETTITFDTYISRVVSDARVQAGRQHLADDGQLLDEIGARYGVQPRFIVALWAIETDFGKVQGDYPIVAALATLAYDGRRGAFFRKELIAALKILDQGHIRPDELRGSWAGAMGQTQFMPSTFLAYAVDYAGTGKQDIWHDKRDALASIANYLSSLGWQSDYTWGRPVLLPGGFDSALLGGQVLKPVDQWRALGVRRTDGGPLPQAAIDAGLVQPGGPTGPTLMVYGNYRAIMKWNRSLYFATAVSYLADRIEN